MSFQISEYRFDKRETNRTGESGKRVNIIGLKSVAMRHSSLLARHVLISPLLLLILSPGCGFKERLYYAAPTIHILGK